MTVKTVCTVGGQRGSLSPEQTTVAHQKTVELSEIG